MRQKEEEIPQESMEYIVRQVRKVMNGEVDDERLYHGDGYISYSFEDDVSGGSVSISYYPTTNGFAGHHNRFTTSFSGFIFPYTSRFDAYGNSYDLNC